MKSNPHDSFQPIGFEQIKIWSQDLILDSQIRIGPLILNYNIKFNIINQKIYWDILGYPIS